MTLEPKIFGRAFLAQEMGPARLKDIKGRILCSIVSSRIGQLLCRSFLLR
jgi:hypothetical protein